MYIQVRHILFKSPPKFLSLSQVWDIHSEELSPTGSKAIQILDSDELRDAALHNQVAWIGNAIQEFQDLLDLSFPKHGRFFNVHYLYFESLSALREAVLSGLNGQFQASLSVLRSALEMFTFHIWWKAQLKFQDSFEPFYEWLFGIKKATGLKNVADSIFKELEMPSNASSRSDFEDVYKELCSYAHKPLIHQAVTTLKGTNQTITNVELLYFWLDLLHRTHRVLLDLAIANSPMSLFPQEIHKKCGFNPPVGIFFDAANFLSIERSLGAQKLKIYQDFYQSREPVTTLTQWFRDLPDRSQHEILSSWSGDQPLGHDDKPFEERVSIGFGMQKATMRSLLRAYAYNPDTPRIESFFQPPKT